MVCQILADSLTNPKDQAALLEKIKGVMSE
jgi:hypothetical protein